MTHEIALGDRAYSSWSLRGWLLFERFGIPYTARHARLGSDAFATMMQDFQPARTVPAVRFRDVAISDSLAIAEELATRHPDAGIWPSAPAARATARMLAAEMHSGFASLRAALPMNLKARFPNFTVWSRAKGDIERVVEIWHDCLQQYGGPFLFGKKPTLADAMYAPVATRFMTYDVALDEVCAAYCQTIMTLPVMKEWIEAAKGEPDDIEELEMEF